MSTISNWTSLSPSSRNVQHTWPSSLHRYARLGALRRKAASSLSCTHCLHTRKNAGGLARLHHLGHAFIDPGRSARHFVDFAQEAGANKLAGADKDDSTVLVHSGHRTAAPPAIH